MMNIRLGKTEDIAKLLELRERAVLAQTQHYSEAEIRIQAKDCSAEKLQSIIDNEEEFLLIGEENGEIVGFVSYAEDSDDPGDWLIRHCFIDPVYFGKGCGTQLVTALVDELKRRNIQLVHAYSRLNATGFYEQLGFEEIGDYTWETEGEKIRYIHFIKYIHPQQL